MLQFQSPTTASYNHCRIYVSPSLPYDVHIAMDSKDLEAPSQQKIRWWSKDTVAVVTGANRGIGLALVKCLAEHGLTVVLTCRDTEKGTKAVDSLRLKGLNVWFCTLDVSDEDSIKDFSLWMQDSFGRLDILVNNAAVSFNGINENSVEHAQTVIKTNYYGPKKLIEVLFPLFPRSQSISRILNISSRLGSFDKVSNLRVRKLLQDEEKLSEDLIDDLIRRFLDQVSSGTWAQEGWPQLWTDYAVSKLALNAYTRVLAKRYQGRGLSINSYCPGFTRTGMTCGLGDHTADTAAEIGAHYLLLPPDELPTGEFFVERKRGCFSKL